ncbi:type I glyceraldehyde-3-phosphate dehydrogenase [Roseovarius faecimaris]|uniref:Glyceraldehyde-3-phosphate dehydrogenase n=1 Tax=Roseovarius faecimaris TaxID=2494550 RepID=A0A6I6IPR1_9RHOB|nr:type I glyceraldehyde-3-phosphate dehydrogenase [Roseovarius faecimaris]QGX98695.1 type I glyceraldehyde-3-phosphate dehydrogenase [Roseovarius faecimaris]
MTTRLAINGFGRIGRNVLRALMESTRTDLSIVAINDLAPPEMAAHLFEFDTNHGRYRGPVTLGDGTLDVGAGPIRLTAIRDPQKLPWTDVDIVLECTGVFRHRDKAALHLANGAARVLVSAPSKGADRTVVYGVNHMDLAASDTIVSNASCTTNCLAPVASVLHDSIGITRGFMTTVHSYTASQPTLDTARKTFARSRAAAENIVPTTTGAAAAVGLVLPELDGRLDGMAVRVPSPNVSMIDLSFEAARATSPDEINAALRAAAAGPLNGVLDTTDRELVSSDFRHDPHSAIVATDQTRVLDGQLCRVLAWYDNEWGFSMRMLDTAAAMANA